MRRITVLIGVLLLLGTAGASFAWTGSDDPVDSVSATPARDDGVLTVGYERGTRPSGDATDAVVVTDENCTPDARGVSHCRNDIRMEDGSTVRVRHDHRMHEVPCLVPGERVRLHAA